MGRGAVRAGTPEDGQAASRITTAGTDGSLTLPRTCTFDGPCRPVIVTNHTAQVIHVKVNGVGDFDNDSDDDGIGHFILAALESKDVSLEGQIAVERVIFATTVAEDLDDVSVVGWRM